MEKSEENYNIFLKDASEYFEIRDILKYSDSELEYFKFDKNNWENYVDDQAKYHIGKFIENYKSLPDEIKSAFYFLIDAAGYSYLIEDAGKYFEDNVKICAKK